MGERLFYESYSLTRTTSLPEICCAVEESFYLYSSEQHFDVKSSMAGSERPSSSSYSVHLRACKHSVYIDHTDAGVKRNHHFLSQRLSLYRKAFSENSLTDGETIPDGHLLSEATNKKNSAESKNAPFVASILRDVNSNIVNGLLLPQIKMDVRTVKEIPRKYKLQKMTAASKRAPVVAKPQVMDTEVGDVKPLSYKQITQQS